MLSLSVGADMQLREFITILGGAVAAVCFANRPRRFIAAQPLSAVWRCVLRLVPLTESEQFTSGVRFYANLGEPLMISQFFEVQIKEGLINRYMDLAASLKPELEAMGGCLFIDRFKSLTRENLLVSYQIWQDEAALTAWRVHAHHHEVQTLGREKVFSDYRIRIAQVIHEARPGQPIWQPERRTPYNDPARRQPTYVLAAESKRATLPVETDWRRDAVESVYRNGHFAHLID